MGMGEWGGGGSNGETTYETMFFKSSQIFFMNMTIHRFHIMKPYEVYDIYEFYESYENFMKSIKFLNCDGSLYLN